MKITFTKTENLGFVTVKLTGNDAYISIDPFVFRAAASESELEQLLSMASKATEKFSSCRRILALTFNEYKMIENQDLPYKEAGFEKVYVNNGSMPIDEFEAVCTQLEAITGKSLDPDISKKPSYHVGLMNRRSEYAS